MIKTTIEEDMKILEGIDVKYFMSAKIEQSDYMIDKADEVNNAIDHILSDYKRVLKENELTKETLIKNCNIADERNQLLKENAELKKFIIEGITIEPNSPYKNYQLDFLRKNFIPRQNIKDKIEKLKNNKENYIFERLTSEDIRKTIITNLQEILEK